jgi:hypothetical protein
MSPENRLDTLDWPSIEHTLDSQGHARLPGLLTAEECTALTASYDNKDLFRSRIVMARHGYGQGEYQYFAYPLPPLVQELRSAIYPRLVPLANRWLAALGHSDNYPAEHGDYLARCHGAGQTRPTPLLLRYGSGDYNCLHRDLYGALAFPLQLAILLSQPGKDFEGGEFVMTEAAARQQSRVSVLPLQQGDALIFTVHERPVPGQRGFKKVAMRHGVSTVRAGQRHTLGVIFHDAS